MRLILYQLILVSLLTLGIAFATNYHYGPGYGDTSRPGWNWLKPVFKWLINLTFFGCIIPVFYTGKSLSEALIFALTNPQYDGRLFIEFPCTELVIQ